MSSVAAPVGVPALDVEKVRKDFPALERLVHGDKPLVYLDNAATSQKPRQVLDALDDYYTRHNANVHRGIHVLAEEATALYEGARDKVAAFINAADRAEVVFTKNSTEALNLAANVIAWAGNGRGLGAGDEVVITEMEHHSNIVPWQLVTARSGATLRWFGLTDEGRLDLSDIDRVITERTKVVSFVLVSNILGTVNPPEELVRRAHEVGALVVVDASQAAPHMPLDVQALGAAVDYLAAVGMDNVRAHEEAITAYALEGLSGLAGVRVLGPADPADRGGAIAFEVAGVHPHDVSQVLDSRGVAVRAGHHCAKPAHQRFGVQSTTRASSYLYTTPAEIDALIDGLEYTKKYFRVD
jgi:selenocysteine lyase/cysteine desulfurase